MTLTWSRFLVVQRTTPLTGSTSLSSMIQLSALGMIPRGAHFGKDPFLRMRRVVTSVPEGLNVREMTSHDATCDAYGFGYRKKNARETMDHGSLHEGVSAPTIPPHTNSETYSYKND